jgi:hypothetical protein
VAVTEEEEDVRGNNKGALGVQNGGLVYKGFSYRRRARGQALFLRKAELGFFHFLEIVKGWLKTRIFRQVRELKIQRKNPGSALSTMYSAYRHCKVPVKVSA